jgi:hypothetical protein
VSGVQHIFGDHRIVSALRHVPGDNLRGSRTSTEDVNRAGEIIPKPGRPPGLESAGGGSNGSKRDGTHNGAPTSEESQPYVRMVEFGIERCCAEVWVLCKGVGDLSGRLARL